MVVVQEKAELPKYLAPFRKIFRFLHLFSGPSRRGDLKDELFIRGLELNILIIVEDWDTVHSRSHDMTVWERVAGLIEMITRGWFNGGHCSPPCNTFSAVLFIPPGPKPVRDRQHLWGLPGLEGKDLLRCVVGSWLARVAMAVTRSLAMCGSSASLEHPSDPGKEPFPSLWLTDEIREMEGSCYPKNRVPFIRFFKHMEIIFPMRSP